MPKKVTIDDLVSGKGGSFFSTNSKKSGKGPKSGQHTAYLLSKLSANAPTWWDTYQEFITSQDADLRKLAFVEYNKVQMKAMPNDLNIQSENTTKIGVVVLPAKTALPAAFSAKTPIEGEVAEPIQVRPVDPAATPVENTRTLEDNPT